MDWFDWDREDKRTGYTGKESINGYARTRSITRLLILFYCYYMRTKNEASLKIPLSNWGFQLYEFVT